MTAPIHHLPAPVTEEPCTLCDVLCRVDLLEDARHLAPFVTAVCPGCFEALSEAPEEYGCCGGNSCARCCEFAGGVG